MFKEGAVPGRIDADVYPAEFEDYSQEATMLDTWVFDKAKDFQVVKPPEPGICKECDFRHYCKREGTIA